MFKKILKWIGIGLLVLIVLIYVLSEINYRQKYVGYQISIDPISIPTDAASIAQGKHVAATHYCALCHNDNLAGDALINQSLMATIYAPNLTSGEGGIGAKYTDEDWLGALRHGIGHDGRGLVGMPSRVWYYMNDKDLGSLIAYLKTLPPVDNQIPSRIIGPMGRVMLALGQFPQPEAAIIDHQAPRPFAPLKRETLAYGEYLAYPCVACHGETFNGGTVRTLDGELITALNITPGGELGFWTEADFITSLRTGVTPSGRVLNETMPWSYVGQMTDEEFQAMWLYLQTLPALEQNLERTDR